MGLPRCAGAGLDCNGKSSDNERVKWKRGGARAEHRGRRSELGGVHLHHDGVNRGAVRSSGDTEAMPDREARVQRRDRLGGVVHEYVLAA